MCCSVARHTAGWRRAGARGLIPLHGTGIWKSMILDKLKYRSREILVALILTLVAVAALIEAWSGREDRAQAVQPATAAGQVTQK
jgi:hypothetical protein